MKEFSFIGKGIVYLGPYAANAKKRDIGNVSQLELAVEEDVKKLPDFRSSGGGSFNISSRISAVNVNATLDEYSPDNLALAAFGDTTVVSTGPISGEAHTAYKDGLIRFNNLPDTSQTITVKKGATTFVENTDYTINSAGIFILAAGAIADSDALTIDYTKKAGNIINALTQSAQELAITFVGLNEAQSGNPVVVDLFRVKFGPVQSLGLIGDDFSNIQLAGEVLSDSAQLVGSKFFKIEQV